MSERPIRSEKLLKNTFWATFGYIIYACIGFVSRSIFVNQLGDTITGVATLFTSILNLLNVTELGFGSAITIHLYKPAADKDEKKIAALIALYGKAFRVFASAGAAIGLVLMIFLDTFVKSDYSLRELRIYFMLYLLKSIASCCFACKSVLISVNQESYRVSNISNAVLIAVTLAQTLILHYTANFILYLVIAIAGVLFTNILTTVKANRLYPYLRQYRKEKVSKEEKKSIFSFIKATAIDRVSTSVKAASDNMIVSGVVNVALTGIIGDYNMIVSTVATFMGFFFNNASPAVGNLAATADKDSQYNTLKDFEFVAFWLYGFVCIGMLCTMTPFIRDVWIRQPERIIPFSTLFLIVFNFFIQGTTIPASIFFNVQGLIKKMPLINFFGMVVNLVLSLALVRWLDADGVYIGTAASFILTNLTLTHYCVLKYHFEGRYKEYWKLYGKCFLITCISGAVCLVACARITAGGLLGVLIRVFICTVCFNAVFFGCTFRSREFRTVCGLVKNMLPGKKTV